MQEHKKKRTEFGKSLCGHVPHSKTHTGHALCLACAGTESKITTSLHTTQMLPTKKTHSQCKISIEARKTYCVCGDERLLDAYQVPLLVILVSSQSHLQCHSPSPSSRRTRSEPHPVARASKPSLNCSILAATCELSLFSSSGLASKA